MSDYPDFEGDKVGLFEVAEWAAKEGNVKILEIVGNDKASGIVLSLAYVVPAGKTLYMKRLSFMVRATLAADRDNNQIGFSYFYDWTDLLYHCWLGGNGGGGLIFPEPAVIPAGNQCRVGVGNYSNHNCDIMAICSGYEI